MSDVRLLELVHEIHSESRGSYGVPRIHAELSNRGVRVGRKRVERLMRRHSLSGLLERSKGRTTIRVPGVRPAPDLVHRDFRPSAPDRLWVADLTEVQTWEGKLYVAVVLDCFSRASSAGRWPSTCGPRPWSRRSRCRPSPQARGRPRPPL